MKHLYALLLALLPLVALAQDPLPLDASGKVVYSEVVEVPGASKDELYSRLREFYVNAFKSADDVIQMDDKEGGKIIGKAWSDFNMAYGRKGQYTQKRKLWYNVKVEVKDGRYRYEISDFLIQTYCNTTGPYANIPCEKQTVPFSVEALMAEPGRYDKDGKETLPYQSTFTGVETTAQSLIASIKSSAAASNASDW